MTRRAALAWALVVTAATALGGCADDGKSFGTLEAPVWEAGYTWTFDAQASFQAKVQGMYAGESDDGQVTLTVLNTTGRVGDRPVYVLSIEGDAHGMPFWTGGTEAVAQDDLETVASVSAPSSQGGTCPVATMPSHGGSFAFPMLEFPLEKGKSWEGAYGPEGQQLGFKATVRGMKTVDVPAGSFEAVHVVVDFWPEFDDMPEDVELNIETARAEFWYSPDARFLVRATVDVEGTASYAGEFVEAIAHAEVNLADHALVAGPEVASGGVDEEAGKPVKVDYQIVSPTTFPLNVAEGGQAVRFMLRKADLEEITPGELGFAPDAQGTSVVNNDDHRVLWTLVNTATGTIVHEGHGPEFTATLSGGGVYRVRAEVEPRTCRAAEFGVGEATVEAFWSKSWVVRPDGGMPDTVHVDGFLAGYGPASAIVAYNVEDTANPWHDYGAPIVQDERGDAVTLAPSGDSSFVFQPKNGFYTLFWDAQGSRAYGQDAPVVTGDTVQLFVTVRYA